MNDEQIKAQLEENQNKFLELRPFKLSMEVPEEALLEIKTFLLWFIHEANTSAKCIFVDTGEIQCEPYKNRSTRDIFVLSRFYFPEVTLLEVVLALVELNETRKIETLQCPHIQSRVWYRVNNKLETSPILSSYDRLYLKTTPVEDHKINILTDGLNYNHLKQIYENSTKEISVPADC